MNSKNAQRITGLNILLLPIVPGLADAQDREIRDHRDFSAIEVSSGIELTIQQRTDFRVEVIVSDGDLADVVTEVEDGALRIRRSKDLWSWFRWFDDYSVHVSLPVLESVTASGGSDVRADGEISGDVLRISASGGSDISTAVAVDDLDVRTSGGSDARLSGTVKTLRARTSGGSDLNAGRLTAKEAHLITSGGSDISIDVLDTIVASASGGSDITYSGNPGTVDIDAGGGADVTRR